MKVKKVGHRGTEIHEADVGPLNWAGDAYRQYEQENLKKVDRNVTMHLGRGYRTAKLKDLPPPNPRPSTKGRTRITNRGTGSRKSTNRGTVG